MEKRKYLFILVCSFFLTSAQPSQVNLSSINSSQSHPLYFNLIKNAFGLTTAEINLLHANRFVVLNRMGTEDILDAYKFYWDEDLPIFITTDTMLHTWHLIFDKTLENLERYIFFPLLYNLSKELVTNALTQYNNELLMEDTLIYLLVASELANASISEDIPTEVQTVSATLLNVIMNEISLEQAIAQLNSNFTSRFIDDFSQYKPRGHYTHSLSLEMYFRLFKWFARIPFFFDDYAGEQFLRTSPSVMIKSSLEVTWLLKETTIQCFGNIVSGLEIWNIFKSFLDTIVGQTNSISPLILNDICSNLIGEAWNLNNINTSTISQIQEEVLNDPSIPEPKIPYVIDVRAGACCSPKTFVLFGERLTLDTFALQNLVHPYVDSRFLPTSLDFAAACLESERSLDHIEAEFDLYPTLSEKIILVQEKLNNISGVEKQTVQWQWIESLKNLAVTEPECNDSISIPEFMNSTAWLDEKLTTMLGSWTQLRHDTILYAKQSYTPYICSTPTGYVEPYPEFYKKLREICELYSSSIAPLEAIGYNFNDYDYYYLTALNDFINATLMLETISYKELKGIELTADEKQFINNTYGQNHICGGPFVEGWLGKIIRRLSRAYNRVAEFPNSRSSLVADIHTDTNTGTVLHLATGLLEPIIAYVPGWNNEEITVVGPVFSFYEFILPSYQRLNDPEWRGILALRLDENNTKDYDFGIFPRGFWAHSYMASTEMTISRIYTDGEDFNPPGWFTGEEEETPEQLPSPPSDSSFIYTILFGIGLASILGLIIFIVRNLFRTSATKREKD
ncbi:MAG: DUF3160 domain-containing protein [Candidatus Hermodarchaeota archaeon]